MGADVRLWALLLTSRLRRGNKRYEAVAEEATARAADLAERVMAQERKALDTEGLADLIDDRTMLSIELQFLWGLFHEFVQEYPELPTSGFDRIKLHLIGRLVHAHSYSLWAARDEANAVEDLYNKADELFEAISGLGKQAYRDARPGHLCTVVKVLHEDRVLDQGNE